MNGLEDVLHRVVTERPDALLLPSAEVLSEAGDSAGALSLARAAVSAGLPADAISRTLLRLVQRAAGATVLSEEMLRLAARLGSAEAMAQLARRLGRNQPGEAEQLLREAIAIQPERIDHRMALARLQRDAGRSGDAITSLLSAHRDVPTAAGALTIAPFLRELDGPQDSADERLRIAVVGNPTLDQLAACVFVEALQAGIRSNVRAGRFDQYAHELLDPSSWLYTFRPDVLILALHRSRLFPRLNVGVGLTEDDLAAEIEAGIGHVRELLLAFRRHSTAIVLVHGIVAPQWPAAGVLDRRSTVGQTSAIAQINDRLSRVLRDEFESVFMIDEDAIQARLGKAGATDPRTWYLARMPWAGDVLIALAREHVRVLRAHRGMSRKCIVVDLDNTMWGGTLGEDGLAALRLATDGPGAPFRAFQQELVSLWSRGVLLAVCSKNDEAEALSAIDEHPAMLLRRSHLATHRINWRDKPQNIRAIASELNIGLDSIVFLDDSPVERAQVRAALPEVLVPELPRDPANYRLAVLELGVFDRIADTAEDALRNEMYRTQRTRMAAAVAAPTLEHHLKALELVVVLEEAISSAIPRVSQLTLKTNQMTVTTRRYSESAINALLAAGALILTATVSDRFGSDGLTGLAIVQPAEDCWEIDSLILSCRVMGRGVESALLAEVVDRARAAGALRVHGTYVRTNRNEPASQIYRENGFVLLSDSDDTQNWELALPSAVPVPDWVEVRRPAPPADRATTRRTVLNNVD